VYSSNRSGKTLTIWQRPANGQPGLVNLSRNHDEQDLWPSVDSDPKPRLFYEAHFDGQADGRLYSNRLNTTIRSELSPIGVSQPRINPKADGVVFVSLNEKTGHRDIYRMSDQGGSPEALCNVTDADSYDPVWSKDGSRLAFASDRGVDEDQRHNADIWIIDLAHPEKPLQVTTNGSVDDCPAWDPTGDAIFFRSNRGGNWGIWRVALK
jgi:Tol biopolymer transport system component